MKIDKKAIKTLYVTNCPPSLQAKQLMPAKGMNKSLWKQYRACNLLQGAASQKSLNKLQTKQDVEDSSIQVENETIDASPSQRRSVSQFRMGTRQRLIDQGPLPEVDPSGTVTPVEYDNPHRENRMLKSSSAIQLKLKTNN